MAGDGDQDGPGGPADVALLSSRDLPAGRSALAELEDYWRILKEAAPHLPRRADLDAGRIAGALPHAFVLERSAAVGARFRIAGNAVAGLLGGEPQGIPFPTLFEPASREELRAWIDRCFEEPALVDLMVQASQGSRRRPLRGRLLLLPMLDDEGQVTRALAGLLMDGPPRRGEHRFELADAVPRVEPIPAAPATSRAFATGAGPRMAPGLREADRPYLRLVVSNP